MPNADSVTADQAERPLVSVIMNCYNGEKYLREAIESVLGQTYHNWEIIFWDDQSTDDSAAIYKTYSDARLRYYAAPKKAAWLYEARNYAIERATGDLIAFLDVDDWWLPTKLEKQITLFSDPTVGFVYGRYWIEHERKKKRWQVPKRETPTGWVLNDLLRDRFIGLLTLVVRRSALNSLEYICDPRYHIIGDFDLAVRLSMHWKLACVQDPVGVYRIHDANLTQRHSSRHMDELMCWATEMSKVEAIRACPNAASFFEGYITYRQGLHHVLHADKKKGYRSFCRLPWGAQKCRLLVLLLLPSALVRHLRS